MKHIERSFRESVLTKKIVFGISLVPCVYVVGGERNLVSCGNRATTQPIANRTSIAGDHDPSYRQFERHPELTSLLNKRWKGGERDRGVYQVHTSTLTLHHFPATATRAFDIKRLSLSFSLSLFLSFSLSLSLSLFLSLLSVTVYSSEAFGRLSVSPCFPHYPITLLAQFPLMFSVLVSSQSGHLFVTHGCALVWIFLGERM